MSCLYTSFYLRCPSFCEIAWKSPIVKTQQKHPLQGNLPWLLQVALVTPSSKLLYHLSSGPQAPENWLCIFIQALLSSTKILADARCWCNSTLLIYSEWHSIWKKVILVFTVLSREFPFSYLGCGKSRLMVRSLHDDSRIKIYLSCMAWRVFEPGHDEVWRTVTVHNRIRCKEHVF